MRVRSAVRVEYISRLPQIKGVFYRAFVAVGRATDCHYLAFIQLHSAPRKMASVRSLASLWSSKYSLST